MVRILLIALYLSFYTADFAEASEVDSFSAHNLTLGDSSQLINTEVNRLLDLSATKANRFKTCSKQRLMERVRDYLAGSSVLGIGAVEKFIDQHPKIDKFTNDLSDSIYGDFSFFEALALHLYGLGTVIRIDESLIGSDKFGHFFWDGWKYYHKVVSLGMRLEDALEYGESTEYGLFGFTMTGVYSYADLAANLGGLKFYMEIVPGNYPKISGLKSSKPFFKCEKGVWKRVRKFAIQDYVDSAWDETVNCNLYRNESLDEKIYRRIAQINSSQGMKELCPISKKRCKKMLTKYRHYADHLISPKCHKAD